jgi:rRNA-processing protein FCF1
MCEWMCEHMTDLLCRKHRGVVYLSLKVEVFMRCSMFTLVGVPCITDCVMGELEKLGPKFRVALR